MIPPGTDAGLWLNDISYVWDVDFKHLKFGMIRFDANTCKSISGVEVPSSNRSELAKYFTIDKGKIIATILAIGFILHHGVMRWRFGADSCNWLLTKGRFQGRTVWQPYGCMMHDYSMQEAHTCFRWKKYCCTFWFGDKDQDLTHDQSKMDLWCQLPGNLIILN